MKKTTINLDDESIKILTKYKTNKDSTLKDFNISKRIEEIIKEHSIFYREYRKEIGKLFNLREIKLLVEIMDTGVIKTDDFDVKKELLKELGYSISFGKAKNNNKKEMQELILKINSIPVFYCSILVDCINEYWNLEEVVVTDSTISEIFEITSCN